VRNAPARLTGRRKDPWRGFFDARQAITSAMLERLGVRPRR